MDKNTLYLFPINSDETLEEPSSHLVEHMHQITIAPIENGKQYYEKR